MCCNSWGRKELDESEVAQSCLTLNDPMDWSPPGSSVHGTLQARVLEWGASSGRLPLHGARSCPSLPLRALSPDEAEILSSFLSFAGGQTQTFMRCQSSPTP